MFPAPPGADHSRVRNPSARELLGRFTMSKIGKSVQAFRRGVGGASIHTLRRVARVDHTPSGEEPRLPDTVRLSAEGLAKVLGDLEARVMASVWELGHAVPAKKVHARVFCDHEVALLTVVTVLNKLVDKGLLVREKRDGLLHYHAVLSEADFRAHVSRRVVEGILSFGPSAVAASFVDVLAERDPAQLAVLKRLIDERLRGEGE